MAKVIPKHGQDAIAAALDGVADPTATRMTNGLTAYKPIGKTQPYLPANHSDPKSARTDETTSFRAYVNRIEPFNVFVRRAVIGVFHFVSVKPLGRYACEVRWDRKADAGLDPMARLVRTGGGRLLSSAVLTAKAARWHAVAARKTPRLL